MKIVCVGGGPAGLYFAILMKLADPEHDVRVLERNQPGDTYGFGVVFSDATLEVRMVSTVFGMLRLIRGLQARDGEPLAYEISGRFSLDGHFGGLRFHEAGEISLAELVPIRRDHRRYRLAYLELLQRIAIDWAEFRSRLPKTEDRTR